MAVMSLSSLPLGFRFRPTDEELIDYYLRLKINGNDKDVRVIREIDVCKVEPWDLPDLSIIPTTDLEWFFFCPRDRKYPNGNRLNRATAAGYWKATGKDRNIKSGTSLIGMKKTLVFYMGRAPKGKRTNWVMHEYRPTLKEMDGTNPGQSAYVLCRLFKKQDDSIEDLNGDELEPTVSSPTTAKSLHEDTESDVALNQASPALREHAENHLPSTDLAEHTNKTTPDAVVSTECDGNITNAYYGKVEVDPLPYIFDDPTSDPIFSPLHSQVQAEFGSSGFYHPETNDFSNSISGVHLQAGTNESDDYISNFIDSVLNSDEYSQEEDYTRKSLIIGESGICSSSGVQAQFELEFQGIDQARNEFRAPESTVYQDAVSGIVRRPRGIQNPSYAKSDVTQGSAPRRIRLDTKYQASARVSLTVKVLRLVGILVLLVMCISLWRYLEF